MKEKARFFLIIVVALLSLVLSSCLDAELPYVGDNGNWFIGGKDSGIPANGKDGAKGEKGDTGDSGKDGEKGETGDSIDGDMPYVTAYEKIADIENGTVYKITFSDGKSTEITVMNGVDGAAAENTVDVPGVVSSFTLIPSAEQYRQETLVSGSRLVFPREKYNNVTSRRTISAFMRLDELGDGKINIGQGKDDIGGSYVEITKTTITVYTNVADSTEPYYIDTKHKIKNVKDFIFITIDSSMGDVSISFMSSGGLYQKEESFWSGSAGDVFIEAVDVELSDVRMSVSAAGYSENIWIFDDSAPRILFNENMLFYFKSHGYDDNLIISSPRLSSSAALAEFERALTKGTPQYAIWAVGGYETDSPGTVNTDYAASTAAFIAKCTQLGITPILSTHPNADGCDNSAKNAFVEKSGACYIDFAAAYGAKDAGDTSLDDKFYVGEGDAKTIDYGAVAMIRFSEMVRKLPEIALNKD